MFENNKGSFFEYFEQSSGLVLRRNAVTYLIFLAFLQLIDVIYLFYHDIQLSYILISKIIVNLAITTLILAKKGRLQYTLINKLLLFAKIFAIILLFLYESHFSLFLVLFDENKIHIKPSGNILSGILVKIGYLVITIKQQTLLDIFVDFTFCCWRSLKRFIYLKTVIVFMMNQFNKNNESPIPLETKLSHSEKSPIISKKQQKIVYHDHNFCKIQDEEKLNQILLEKIIFQIISSSDD